MTLASYIFDQSQAPTLTRGASLGASGVSHPSFKTIGVMTGLSSANGSFWTQFMDGQIDYDNSGYLYVADELNGRIQRFVKNASGSWIYDSQVLLSAALGTGLGSAVAIDRTRSEIHIAAKNQTQANTWAGVWLLSQWPTLTVANRQRSYGSNDGAGLSSGVLGQGSVITIAGDYSYVVSSTGNNRIVAWNHLTGALFAQTIATGVQNRIIYTGSKFYVAGFQTTGTNPGVWNINGSTLAGISRIDGNVDSSQVRRGYASNFGSGIRIGDLGLHGTRLYVREYARIMAFETTTDLYVDDFAWAGHSTSNAYLGQISMPRSESAKYGRMVFWRSPDTTQPDELIMWQNNADNTAQQSWLSAQPVSTSTATWTYTDWSEGTNTIEALVLQGTNISSEKIQIRLRKNGGPWLTITMDELATEATLASVGTFTSGDSLTVELSMSTWDRLDGHATLVGVREKLPPTNVSIAMIYDDTAATVYTSLPTASIRGRMLAAGFKGRASF